MSQTDKAAYYQQLKKAGVEFPKPYREFTEAELKEAYDYLIQESPEFTLSEAAVSGSSGAVPVAPANHEEMPGQRLNTHADHEPVRVDPDTGLIWYQEEVRKPAFPKPRGRRVLRYNETGVKVETATVGEYTETFEVAGDQASRSSEIKITMPSYQVGIYKDPRFPFKIHIYNEVRGFNFFEVNDFYGGADLVPDEVKRMYVQNDLCYDIRTVVRAIETEHRALQLQGKVD